MVDHTGSYSHSLSSCKGYSEEFRSPTMTFLKENKTNNDELLDISKFSYLLSLDTTNDRSGYCDNQNFQAHFDFEEASDKDVLQFLNFEEKMNLDEDSLRNPSNALLTPTVEDYEEVKMQVEQEVLKSMHDDDESYNLIENPLALKDSFNDIHMYEHVQNSYHTQNIHPLSFNDSPSKEDVDQEFEIEELPSKKVKGQEWTSQKVYLASKDEAVEPKTSDTTNFLTFTSYETNSTMNFFPDGNVSGKRPERNYLKLFVKGMQKMMERKKIGLFLDTWTRSDIVTKQDVFDSLAESCKAATSKNAFKESVFVDPAIIYSIDREDVLKVAKLELAKEFVKKDNYEWWANNLYAPFSFGSKKKSNAENEEDKRQKRESFKQERERLCKKFLSCFQDPDVEFDI